MENKNNAVPVLIASAKRLYQHFIASFVLATGGFIVGLPEIVPVLKDMLPDYAKKIGWGAMLIGWAWKCTQSAKNLKPNATKDVDNSTETGAMQ